MGPYFRGAFYHAPGHAEAVFRRRALCYHAGAVLPLSHQRGHKGWQDHSAPLKPDPSSQRSPPALSLACKSAAGTLGAGLGGHCQREDRHSVPRCSWYRAWERSRNILRSPKGRDPMMSVGHYSYPVMRSITRGRRIKSTITTKTMVLTSAAVDATSFPIFASGWGALVPRSMAASMAVFTHSVTHTPPSAKVSSAQLNTLRCSHTPITITISVTMVPNLMLCSCVRTNSSPASAYLPLASRSGLDGRPGGSSFMVPVMPISSSCPSGVSSTSFRATCACVSALWAFGSPVSWRLSASAAAGCRVSWSVKRHLTPHYAMHQRVVVQRGLGVAARCCARPPL